ncbi:MAG: hypothetical protein ACLFUL_04865 [Desulfobacteraceae bacterium]
MKTLDRIPLRIGLDEVRTELGNGDWDLVQRLLDKETCLIRPRAAYGVSRVTGKYDRAAVVDGVLLKSRVLAHHLQNGMRVFPFVVTIGRGLESRADATKELPARSCLHTIGNLALNKARRYLKNYLKKHFAHARLSHLSPGSLNDWPLEAQRPLFSILKGAERAIGVQLTHRLLMKPTKSVSGIFFPTQTPFESCRLCPRGPCQGRRAPYNADLVEEYGIKSL